MDRIHYPVKFKRYLIIKNFRKSIGKASNSFSLSRYIVAILYCYCWGHYSFTEDFYHKLSYFTLNTLQVEKLESKRTTGTFNDRQHGIFTSKRQSTGIRRTNIINGHSNAFVNQIQRLAIIHNGKFKWAFCRT